MSENDLEKKTMYSVEKFLPPQCPGCRHNFDKVSEDWAHQLGHFVDGKKVPSITVGYSVIICMKCLNSTAYIPLESWTLFDEEAAKKLLEEGFVNLQKVEAVGNMAQERHVVFNQLPKIRTIIL